MKAAQAKHSAMKVGRPKASAMKATKAMKAMKAMKKTPMKVMKAAMKAMKATKAMKKDEEDDDTYDEGEEEEEIDQDHDVDLSQGPWSDNDEIKKRPAAKGAKGGGQAGKAGKAGKAGSVMKKPSGKKTTYEAAEDFKKGHIYWVQPNFT